MKRERALKIVLVVVGVLFCAALYALVLMVKQEPALAMMMSLYVTLGILHGFLNSQSGSKTFKIGSGTCFPPCGNTCTIRSLQGHTP
jgi:hypothetical protein